MFILLGYGVCLELCLVGTTLLFGLSVACLLLDHGSLQLGSLIRITAVTQRRDSRRSGKRRQFI